MALVFANLSIFSGKVFATYMLLAAILNPLAGLTNQEFVATDDYMISVYADEIVDQKYTANEEIVYPRNEVATFDFSVDYSPDLWKEAETRWTGMSDAEKQKLKNKYEAEPNGNDSYYVSFVAEDVMAEKWDAGIEVEYVETSYEYEYPSEIWAQAKAQWDELPPDQQTAKKKAEESGMEGIGAADLGSSLISITWSTLGPLDGLWVLLASFTAFRVGANEHDG